VQYLAHSASFHSDDEIASSKPRIKHLVSEAILNAVGGQIALALARALLPNWTHMGLHAALSD
jgi:hypothetical protein